MEKLENSIPTAVPRLRTSTGHQKVRNKLPTGRSSRNEMRRKWLGFKNMAEREGFEPPIPFRVCRFSRPEPSTTRPPLRARSERKGLFRDPRSNCCFHYFT